MPAARKPRKRIASTLVGLASRVHFHVDGYRPVRRRRAVEDCADRCGLHQRRRAAAEEDCGDGPSGYAAQLLRRFRPAKARAKRASSTPPCRTWLLKSQYGHFDRQNGQWM